MALENVDLPFGGALFSFSRKYPFRCKHTKHVLSTRGVRRIFSGGGGLKSGPKYFAPENFKIADTFFFFFVSKFENLTFFFVGGGGGGVRSPSLG